MQRFGSIVAYFRYSPIDILSVHLPPPMPEFNGHVQQEWIKKEADELLGNMETFYAEISDVLDMEEKSKRFGSEMSDLNELQNHIMELKDQLTKERDDCSGLLQEAIEGTSLVDQRPLDILELNNLRRALIIGSHVWDRQLYSLDSLLKTNSIVKAIHGDALGKKDPKLDYGEKYMDYRKLAKLASEINAQNKNLLAVVVPEGPEPREVELYVEEIGTLMQLGEDYTEFMVSKIKALSSVDPDLVPRATKSFRSGSFSEVAQDITGFYVTLEGFFMVENVRKGINIDEHVPDSLTTSMVDGVFYVLQSCLRRAISTSNISSVVAVLSGASSLLSNEYHEALLQNMREPNLGAKLFLGGVGVQKTGTEIATALNNMDVSSEYVLKLKHEIEEQCAEVFPAPADREESCLSKLVNMSNTFKQALNAGTERLVSTVTPRIRPVLDSAATISYELSESEYADNEVNDPSV